MAGFWRLEMSMRRLKLAHGRRADCGIWPIVEGQLSASSQGWPLLPQSITCGNACAAITAEWICQLLLRRHEAR